MCVCVCVWKTREWRANVLLQMKRWTSRKTCCWKSWWEVGSGHVSTSRRTHSIASNTNSCKPYRTVPFTRRLIFSTINSGIDPTRPASISPQSHATSLIPFTVLTLSSVCLNMLNQQKLGRVCRCNRIVLHSTWSNNSVRFFWVVISRL